MYTATESVFSPAWRIDVSYPFLRYIHSALNIVLCLHRYYIKDSKTCSPHVQVSCLDIGQVERSRSPACTYYNWQVGIRSHSDSEAKQVLRHLRSLISRNCIALIAICRNR